MGRDFLIAAALVLTSCTVKEERSGCPCLLNFDFDEVIESGQYYEAVTTLGSPPDNPLEQELIRVAPYKDIGYEVSVPRRTVSASVVCGCGREKFSGESVIVACSPVMAFAASVHCRDDKASVEVELHKQYSRVQLQPEGYNPGDEYPYDVRLNAASNSLALYDFEPCGEPFSVMFPEDLCVNLPRQSRGSVLTLDVLGDEPEPVFSVDLSAKLKAADFDWEAEDLADIVVKLDFSQMTCSVAVLPWEENSEYRHIDI